jgi:hypothetical protein
MLLCLLLGGCSGMDLFAPAPQVFSAPGPCGALARQRLEDARMMDLAGGLDRAIFTNTYQACLAQSAGTR